MPDYVCVIQEAQAADRKRAALTEGLTRIGQEAFGDDPSATTISWMVVKKGFAWTAGAPSTASIVARSVPVGLPLDRREAFMHQVCDLWTTVTGCTIGEIVVTAWDGPLPL
jgi:phenylpyruvate tautomerase PptA (4-oxalocrotonate tautomerase family)